MTTWYIGLQTNRRAVTADVSRFRVKEAFAKDCTAKHTAALSRSLLCLLVKGQRFARSTQLLHSKQDYVSDTALGSLILSSSNHSIYNKGVTESKSVAFRFRAGSWSETGMHLSYSNGVRSHRSRVG